MRWVSIQHSLGTWNPCLKVSYMLPKIVWPWKYYTNLFKVGLQNGPQSKGKIVDSSLEEDWRLGGLIADFWAGGLKIDSSVLLHISFSRASTLPSHLSWRASIYCLPSYLELCEPNEIGPTSTQRAGALNRKNLTNTLLYPDKGLTRY